MSLVEYKNKNCGKSEVKCHLMYAVYFLKITNCKLPFLQAILANA
jgi:hypothetical protein